LGWVVNATPRPIYPRERQLVLTVQEGGWTPGAIWTGVENLAPTGIRSPDGPAHTVKETKLTCIYKCTVYCRGGQHDGLQESHLGSNFGNSHALIKSFFPPYLMVPSTAIG
jgi:hypothetical protein